MDFVSLEVIVSPEFFTLEFRAVGGVWSEAGESGIRRIVFVAGITGEPGVIGETDSCGRTAM